MLITEPLGGPKIIGPMKKRLSREATMEFGFSVREGQTLDKDRCSTAHLDEAKLTVALSKFHQTISNEFTQLANVTRARMRHFVLGLPIRTRIRGGVSLPILQGYVGKQGNTFYLSKAIEDLLSPLGRCVEFLTTDSIHYSLSPPICQAEYTSGTPIASSLPLRVRGIKHRNRINPV